MGALNRKDPKPVIYVTRRIPEEALTYLRQHAEVRQWEEENEPVPRDVLEREITEADGLYCLLTETIDDALLQQAPRLKVISNMAVGYNNIDVKAATARGIWVTNTPGVLTETTADLTFALLMATARRLPEAERFLRDGSWKTWSPMLLTGVDVYGATLGIIGLGRIGAALARRARGFDMKVLYSSRSRKPEAEREYGLEWRERDALLAESDFVVIMTPYTAETKNLISHRELARMKRTAVLINTARGGIVDEEALYDALKQGTIHAAGLDVFAQEPIQPNHPLLTLPNVVVLPHIGSASVRTRTQMAMIAAHNVIAAANGRRPENAVNDVDIKL